MREVFKGWPRKGGVATLVMACVVTSIWARSYHATDIVTLPDPDRGICYFSCDGRFCEERFATLGEVKFKFVTKPPQSIDDLADSLFWHRWNWRIAGFGELKGSHFQNGGSTFRFVPYWPIVFALTILSATLLLWPDNRNHDQVKRRHFCGFTLPNIP